MVRNYTSKKKDIKPKKKPKKPARAAKKPAKPAKKKAAQRPKKRPTQARGAKKKPMPVPARWRDRTDDDWERWGQQLGKRIEKRSKHFAEEMEWHGKKLEKHGQKLERDASSWWYRTFGPVGPAIESLIGIAVICIAAIVINSINVLLLSGFASSLAFFLMDYIPVFFGLFLFFNYAKYVHIVAPKTKRFMQPFTTAAGIAVCLWFIAWISIFVYQSSGNVFFQGIAGWIFLNLWGLLLGLLVIAYLVSIMVHSEKRVVSEGK